MGRDNSGSSANTRSKALAIASIFASDRLGPTIWKPNGMPSSSFPHGRQTTGLPVVDSALVSPAQAT